MSADRAATSVDDLVTAHLATWNAPPGPDRDAAVAQVYAADVFVGEPGAAHRGHDGMSRAISALQDLVPGATITLAGPMQVAQDLVTYGWVLGVPGQPAVASGRDVLLVRADRIVSLYVLVDAP